MYRYRIFGCNVASEITCPGLLEGEGEPDVTVRMGATPERLAHAAGGGVCYSASPGEVLISLPGVGRFHLRNGDQIVIEPAQESTLEDVRPFLLNLAIGVLLQQREGLVLHAAVVEAGNGCIALAGDSGAGKSTLTAYLHARGWRVLSDEICLIPDAGNECVVSPGLPYLQLWADTLKRLGHDPSQLEPVRPGLEKFILPLGARHLAESRPLRGIYFLALHNGSEVEIQALRGAEHVESIVRNTYRLEYLKPMGRKADHFRSVLRLAQKVPARRLCVPGSYSSIVRTVDLLASRLAVEFQ